MPKLVNILRQSLRIPKRLIPASIRTPIRRLLRARTALARENARARYHDQGSGELVPGFRISAADTVVDVGCGPGESSAFAASTGAEVVAVDIDPGVVDAMRRRLQMAGSARGFEVHVSDSNPLPIADGRASRVISEEVLEHVDDPRQFLAELYRVGRPGALYLISVPDPASENVMKHFVPDLCWQKPYHIHVYDREEFIGLVRGAGLEVISHDVGGFYSAMWWFLMWGSQIRGDVEFGTDQSPALRHWNRTWNALLSNPEGRKVRAALDRAIPKCQRIIARKPG